MLSELHFVTRTALGIVFLISAIAKLRDPRGFAKGVAEYRLVWSALTTPVSFLVIVIEFWLSIAHLLGLVITLTASLALAVLAGFAIAVGVNLSRGRELPCYCFGRGREQISWHILFRLLLLAFGEVFLLTTNQYARHFARLPEIAMGFFWATLITIVGSWLLNLGDLMSLLRPGTDSE